ncbi:MAG: glutamate racemase [Eubacteriales bacterium]|nr:glutamate racemase [Eubacteriales bacterium]
MDERPIGVFDSGFGGISVLAEAVRVLPEEDFIFLGDNLHAPYGDRMPQEVLALTRQALDRLMSMGCKAILIACNTATSAAAAVLRSELGLPIVGMEPALKPAALLPGEGRVLVMATAMTLKMDKFQNLMDHYGRDATPVPCPGLVELVEAGEMDGTRVRQKLCELLSPYLDRPVKAVVLGCTHYVFLKAAIAACLPADVVLVDGNEGTARQLQNQLVQKNLLRAPAVEGQVRRGNTVFLSTAEDETVPARMCAQFALALQALDVSCISPSDALQ